MYAIEIEQDSRGEMADRVLRYTVGGAMFHNMTSTKARIDIALPQPCVVFLKSTRSTPRVLTWNVECFDGQSLKLKIPAIRLACPILTSEKFFAYTML